MSMMQSLYQKFANTFIFWLFLLFGVPLVALSFFNLPSAADDYCFALNTIKFGFWQGQQYYYDGWTGRYFSTFLMHANPLVFGWLGWYKIFPILVLGFLTHSIYSLLQSLTQSTLSKRKAWLCTAGLMFLYLFSTPRIVENFYWLPGVVGYPLPMVLMAYLFVVINNQSNYTKQSSSILHTIWAGFLIFAIVGSNETPLLGLTILLVSIVGLRVLKRLKISAYWLVLLAILGVSIYLDLSAPGNKVRMGFNPISGLLIPSVLSSLKETLEHTADWLLHTPLLFFTALFIPLADQLLVQLKGKDSVFEVHPFFSLLIWIGVVSVGVFPGYYGIGIPPPPRTINVVYLFFLIGWFFNVLVIIHFIKKRWHWYASIFPSYAKLILGFWILTMLPDNPNLRMLYGDLFKGRAKQYHQELQARYEVIAQSKNRPMVTIDSLKTFPKSLYTEDISTSPTFLWNTCQAEYWGLKAMKLRGETMNYK